MYAGAWQQRGRDARRVREYVRHRGGLQHVGSLTQVVLSLLGHLPWDRYPKEMKPDELPFILSDSPLNEWVNSAFASYPAGAFGTLSRREAALKWAEAFMIGGWNRTARYTVTSPRRF
nr:hypothetical protein [Polycladomyces subterraneus]